MTSPSPGGSPSTHSPVGSDPEAHGMPTWHIFVLIACLWLAVSAYTNERVLTPEAMAGLVDRTTGVEMSVTRLDEMRRRGRLMYPLLPLLLLIRVAVVALTLQLFSMLMAHPLPYREAFRAGLWGFAAVIYGTFVRMLRLDLLPSGALTREELAVVPDSIAVLILGSDGSVTVLTAALSLLSLHDAFWIAIVSAYLHASTGLDRGVAIAIALSGWTATALARLGAQAFMIGMFG